MLSVAERIIAGEIDPPPVAKLIGFNLRSLERGRAVLDMEAGPQHWNPMGGLLGGILCDLTDVAMGIAYSSTLAEGEAFATVELKINFLLPVKQGHLIAEGWVVSGGRHLSYTEAEVRDDDGRLIAKASSTCKKIPAPEPLASTQVDSLPAILTLLRVRYDVFARQEARP